VVFVHVEGKTGNDKTGGEFSENLVAGAHQWPNNRWDQEYSDRSEREYDTGQPRWAPPMWESEWHLGDVIVLIRGGGIFLGASCRPIVESQPRSTPIEHSHGFPKVFLKTIQKAEG